MSDLNALFEAFKAFIMVQVKHALESALEGVDSRLESIEESLDGRDIVGGLDSLERESQEHDNRLDGLVEDVRDLSGRIRGYNLESLRESEERLDTLEDDLSEIRARLSALERFQSQETDAGPEPERKPERKPEPEPEPEDEFAIIDRFFGLTDSAWFTEGCRWSESPHHRELLEIDYETPIDEPEPASLFEQAEQAFERIKARRCTPRFNVATYALWRTSLCALEVHFKGDDSDASRAFAMLSECLREINT